MVRFPHAPAKLSFNISYMLLGFAKTPRKLFVKHERSKMQDLRNLLALKRRLKKEEHGRPCGRIWWGQAWYYGI